MIYIAPISYKYQGALAGGTLLGRNGCLKVDLYDKFRTLVHTTG